MVPREDSDLINGLNLAWISNLMTSLDRNEEVGGGLAGRCRSKGTSWKHTFPLTLSSSVLHHLLSLRCLPHQA